MKTIKQIYFLILMLSLNQVLAQTVVKMDMPPQADQPLKVVALFDEEIPEGIPVVLGLMGYDIKGGLNPVSFEWLLNGQVISTSDIAVFTPKKGDDLSLKVTDKSKCWSKTSFNLKFARIPQNPDDAENSIKIFPTVINSYVHINIPKTENNDALVRIFNLNGTKIYEKHLPESANITLNLTPGTYFVSVKTKNLHKVEKIIAQ